MRIPSKFKFQSCFGFYITLLKDMLARRAPSYDVIHSAGQVTVVKLILLLYL